MLQKGKARLRRAALSSNRSLFPIPIMALKGTLPADVFKTPLPGQRVTSPAAVQVTDDDISFVMAPECLYVKPQNGALIACELPC